MAPTFHVFWISTTSKKFTVFNFAKKGHWKQNLSSVTIIPQERKILTPKEWKRVHFQEKKYFTLIHVVLLKIHHIIIIFLPSVWPGEDSIPDEPSTDGGKTGMFVIWEQRTLLFAKTIAFKWIAKENQDSVSQTSIMWKHLHKRHSCIPPVLFT